jgi:hypothetical protein
MSINLSDRQLVKFGIYMIYLLDKYKNIILQLVFRNLTHNTAILDLKFNQEIFISLDCNPHIIV